MKNEPPHAEVAARVLVALGALLSLCAWPQPIYVQLDPVGYCAWQTSQIPLTASVQGSNLFTIDDGSGLNSVAVGDSSHPAILARWSSGAPVCNVVEGMRLQRSSSLFDAPWEDVRSVAPGEVVLVPMEGGQAFFRLAKP